MQYYDLNLIPLSETDISQYDLNLMPSFGKVVKEEFHVLILMFLDGAPWPSYTPKPDEPTGGGLYFDGDIVTIYAPDLPGYRFDGWHDAINGGVFSTSNTYTFRVSASSVKGINALYSTI